MTQPALFISHATTDKSYVDVINAALRRVFGDRLDLFASSVSGDIPAGAKWLETINTNLQRAEASVILLTPISLHRPWIWFEVGASWAKMEEGKGRILPICIPEVDLGALPTPLNTLQAVSLGDEAGVTSLFESLVELFGFGDSSNLDYADLKQSLPDYEKIEVKQEDLDSGSIYDGPYEGYTDEELVEMIHEYWVRPDAKANICWDDQRGEVDCKSSLLNGRLIHFQAVDQDLQLPPGTARRLLIITVTALEFVDVDVKGPNTVRFRIDPERLVERAKRLENAQ